MQEVLLLFGRQTPLAQHTVALFTQHAVPHNDWPPEHFKVTLSLLSEVVFWSFS
ncbi:MAG: hypothetical protein I8H75_02715 [Myxococcaceae bacterium]|nr:hypothetical protein [Myxococcaceae bacterium]